MTEDALITSTADAKVPPHRVNPQAEFQYVVSAYENGLYFLGEWEEERLRVAPEDDLIELAASYFDIVSAFATKAREQIVLSKGTPNFFDECVVELGTSLEQTSSFAISARTKPLQEKLANLSPVVEAHYHAKCAALRKAIALIEKRAMLESLIEFSDLSNGWRTSFEAPRIMQ